MNKYFRLYFYCKLLLNESGGCIYNMMNNNMIYIERENSKILERCEKNELINDNVSYEFCKELKLNGLGDFYSNITYVDAMRLGGDKVIKKIVVPNTKIQKVYIQGANECSLDCVFCNSDNSINKKTGCKKWEIEDANISSVEWEKVLTDLRYIGVTSIEFIGGDPLLNFDKIKTIVGLAKAIGIKNYSINTNLSILDDDIINFSDENNIDFTVQIITLNNEKHRKVTQTLIDSDTIFANINSLLVRGIKVKTKILISKYNENEILEIHKKLLQIGITNIEIDFIHNKPHNNHFSEKYINEIYNKENKFDKVTKESISVYSQYNSCLFNIININIKGDVTPCPMMNSIVLGNIRNESIQKIMKNEKYDELITLSRNNIKKCCDCIFRLNCFDCRAIEYSATGNIGGMEYCNIIQAK